MQYKDFFKDKEENYKPIIGDHIAYRFQIVKILGSGAFGKVNMNNIQGYRGVGP